MCIRDSMKDALAMHLYSTLMQRLQPGTVFDLGTAGGGSALWFADQLRAMGLPSSTVLTADIEDLRDDTCRALHAATPNLVCVHGDLSRANAVAAMLASAACGLELVDAELTELQLEAIKDKLPHPWLVAEDCHVPTAQLVRSFEMAGLEVGDYIIFEDTHPNHPDAAGMSSLDMENYSCGEWAGVKLEEVEKAMHEAGCFMIDSSIQDMYGINGATFVNSVYVKVRSLRSGP
eukprot:TRINITY_DN36567_c0_g1_i2.p1 TRINITY_DN36567_c0_g1~~TRINITY_DN36567_c0_g1_i2.p1  ORF type:complete len:233 (-),score=61.59 TRINITY_DN36567_c0_g1_i2:116-814(-)